MDLEKPKKPDSFFAMQLLTFHRTRNRALGVKYDNQFNIGLLQFAYQLQQGEIRQSLDILSEAAFLKGVILQCKAEIKRLIGQANTPQKRREALPVVQKLHDQAERAKIRLEALE